MYINPFSFPHTHFLVSSLAANRPQSLAIGGSSTPTGRRSRSPAPDLDPVDRERVHSFDSRLGRGRLALPPGSPRAISSEQLVDDGVVSAFISPAKLERTRKEADLAGLSASPRSRKERSRSRSPSSARDSGSSLQVKGHRERSRSKSPGPPKTSVTRNLHSPSGHQSRRLKLTRSRTEPEESPTSPPPPEIPPRPLTFTSG